MPPTPSADEAESVRRPEELVARRPGTFRHGLAERDGDPTRRLIAMLREADLDTRLGACQALIMLKESRGARCVEPAENVAGGGSLAANQGGRSARGHRRRGDAGGARPSRDAGGR